jgi:hypothetical protein
VSICALAVDTRFGWDRHIWDATEYQIRSGIQVEFATCILSTLAVWLIKMSLLVFYQRLLTPAGYGLMRYTLIFFAILFTVWYVALTVALCLMCR